MSIYFPKQFQSTLCKYTGDGQILANMKISDPLCGLPPSKPEFPHSCLGKYL